MSRIADLQDLLLRHDVLTRKDKLKRKFCWRRTFDAECELAFHSFMGEYGLTEDEAWWVVCNDKMPTTCPICGKRNKFNGRGYNTTCGECSANAVTDKIYRFKTTVSQKDEEDVHRTTEKRKRTNLERYGEEMPYSYGSKSFSDLMVNRYGSPHYNNHEKAVRTNLERYGVETNLLAEGMRECIRIVKNERYGDENYNNREKCRMTCLDRYGVDFSTQTTEMIRKSIETKRSKSKMFAEANELTSQSELVRKYGRGWLRLDFDKIANGGRKYLAQREVDRLLEYIHTNHHDFSQSKMETEMYEVVRKYYQGEVERNVRGVLEGGLELDILIPKMNLAFEFNGDFWHSDRFKDIRYHRTKRECAERKGIWLIQIYESDWIGNRHKMEAIIRDAISCRCEGVKPKMGRYFDKFGIFDLDVSPNEEFDKYTVITSLPNVQVIHGLTVHRSGLVITMI